MGTDTSWKILTTELVFPVYEMRPMHKPLYRYANGEWIPDDGEWDLAFITKEGAWYVEYVHLPYYVNLLWSLYYNNKWHHMFKDGYSEWISWHERYRHPNIVAGDSGIRYCIDKLKCGAINGEGPEFRIGDYYIRRGMVRVRDTHEIITFPRKFVCAKCGLTLEAIGKDGVIYIDSRKDFK